MHYQNFQLWKLLTYLNETFGRRIGRRVPRISFLHYKKLCFAKCERIKHLVWPVKAIDRMDHCSQAHGSEPWHEKMQAVFQKQTHRISGVNMEILKKSRSQCRFVIHIAVCQLGFRCGIIDTDLILIFFIFKRTEKQVLRCSMFFHFVYESSKKLA